MQTLRRLTRWLPVLTGSIAGMLVMLLAGGANLAYLSTLNVDALKIDRMFTQSIGSDTVGSAIVDQICKMAALLKVDVIVEGVETEARVDCMVALFPDAIGLGWLFGKAVPAEDFPCEVGDG